MIKNLRAGPGLAAALAALVLLGPPLAAAGPRVQPFSQFLRGIETAQAGTYVGAPGAAVTDAAAFAAMRRHLLDLYRGVRVTRSFAEDGQVFDCVVAARQPGLAATARPAAPPPAAPREPASPAMATQVQHCGDGTIPMRRLTLRELTRFASLADFLHKAPGGTAPPPSSRP